ncbi:ABC transporter ATP-binding protein [Bifidobacterium avesanii]|uniref:ATP-binding cassette domain-containing protein n=1 Tax=Bifidobacterium avesanii TaxID=1798157 RepID=A0A7K3THA2_9BIFI|nr:ABC transporter ATP-binding protein [Bifidobacterium avesanii]KAB8293567.1 ABC transporter ATP-binding protein [Bifidobacterium avesanii]NEG78296.1 ATP-binding cassette domain-containing protein [Bifidobacterium avesanii]
MALLEVHDLTRTFMRRGRPFAAVDHVNLTLDAGRFVAIVGRSGNGKSTLLNLVTGLLRPTSGTVSIDGRVVADLDDRGISELRNRTIGFVTQSQTLLANLTVLDNVILPATLGGARAESPAAKEDLAGEENAAAKPAPEPADAALPDTIAPLAAPAGPDAFERRAMDLLERLGVADLASCRPRELSGGEMRRVSIARALMNRPKLLIADEPTGDLDAESTAIVMRLLRDEANRGAAVLMVTHDPDALAYADAVYAMDRGVLTAR